jgi:uncharacterized membrane protein (DUF2068 family)
MIKGKGDRAVRVIGGFKLAKGALLLVFAAGVLSHINADWEQTLSRLIRSFNADPDSKYFTALLTKVGHLSPKRALVVVGTACYGVLFCVEGLGLLRKKRWAEYLTVIATSSFVPLEVYELIKQVTATRVIVLILNVAIAIYLIIRLKRDKHKHTT